MDENRYPIARAVALQKLREIAARGDVDREADHSEADTVLCELLRSIGYGDVVDAYDEIGKWYA